MNLDIVVSLMYILISVMFSLPTENLRHLNHAPSTSRLCRSIF